MCNRDTIPAYDGQKDRRMDILPRDSPRYAYASRGKNQHNWSGPGDKPLSLQHEMQRNINKVAQTIAIRYAYTDAQRPWGKKTFNNRLTRKKTIKVTQIHAQDIRKKTTKITTIYIHTCIRWCRKYTQVIHIQGGTNTRWRENLAGIWTYRGSCRQQHIHLYHAKKTWNSKLL